MIPLLTVRRVGHSGSMFSALSRWRSMGGGERSSMILMSFSRSSLERRRWMLLLMHSAHFRIAFPEMLPFRNSLRVTSRSVSCEKQGK